MLTGQRRIPLLALSKKNEAPLLLRSLALKLEQDVSVIFLQDPPETLTAQIGNAPVPSLLLLIPEAGTAFAPNVRSPPTATGEPGL
jgi:hypothetical protein